MCLMYVAWGCNDMKRSYSSVLDNPESRMFGAMITPHSPSPHSNPIHFTKVKTEAFATFGAKMVMGMRFGYVASRSLSTSCMRSGDI